MRQSLIFKDSYKIVAIVIVATILNTITTYFSSFSRFNLFNIQNESVLLLINSLMFFIITFIVVFLIYRLFFSTSSQYSIAVIGYPKSGKTTFIIRCFDQIYKSRLLSLSLKLSGESTIQRVNEYIAKLKKGEAIGPTKDQDIFAYRASYVKGNLLKKNYKIEFGDFPGEDTEEYLENYGKWLHKTPYFKWVTQADAFIFVVDLGKYVLDGRSYVADYISAGRAAYETLMEIGREINNKVEKKPVMLLFNKADVINCINENEVSEESINKRAFGDLIPETENLNREVFDKISDQILEDFHDLIYFFKSHSSNFSVEFVSSFATMDSKYVGIEKSLYNLLP